MTATTTTGAWRTLNQAVAVELTESRLQLHYAAQFATALGISYLAAASDDSHTNLEWNARYEAQDWRINRWRRSSLRAPPL